LFSSGEAFERVISGLRRNKERTLPALVGLLHHPDPGWRRVAATALGRLRQTPARALPELIGLLRSRDASDQVAALSAVEWLPRDARDRAVPAVVRLLSSRQAAGPAFTHGRAHVPRSIAAHFLGLHGGARGLAALRRAALRRNDPVIHQIDAALEEAATPPNKRLQPAAAGAIMSRRG
jgi:hypothetical protein